VIPPAALCARCGLPRTPLRPLVLSWWGKPYCGLCCGFVMADHDRPVAKPHAARSIRPWKTTELIGEKPVAEWPWRDIIGAESRARTRARKGPRCAACGEPMLCGQTSWVARDVAGALPVRAGRHWACERG
jgi:hypothetical protein